MRPAVRFTASRSPSRSLLLLGATPALAMQFNLGQDAKLTVDTTLSYGYSIRAQERDLHLIGNANGGKACPVNEDDGNLNFDKGDPFANVVKATVDAEVKWGNFGFFGRGSAYYDFELNDSDKLRLTGRDRLGQDAVASTASTSPTSTCAARPCARASAAR